MEPKLNDLLAKLHALAVNEESVPMEQIEKMINEFFGTNANYCISKVTSVKQLVDPKGLADFLKEAKPTDENEINQMVERFIEGGETK